MSQRHRFLLLRDLDWSWFNALVFGMRDGAQLARRWRRSRRCVRRRSATARRRRLSTSVGLYLHCYPLNSVQALHLHIVDLAAVGPSYKHLSHRIYPWTPSSPSSARAHLARSPASVGGPTPRLRGRSFDVVCMRKVVAGLVATGRRAGQGGPLLEPPAAPPFSAPCRVALPRRRRRSDPAPAAALCFVQELAPAPARRCSRTRCAPPTRARRPSGRPTGRRAPTTAWRWLRSSHGSHCCSAPLSSLMRRRRPPPPRQHTYTMQPTVPTPPTAPPARQLGCEPPSVDSDGAWPV